MSASNFSKEFLRDLPEDTDEALIALQSEYYDLCESDDRKESHLKAYGILVAFGKARGITVPNIYVGDSNFPALRSLIFSAFNNLATKAEERRSVNILARSIAEHEDLFSGAVAYEFSENDWNRVQVLINELREEIVRNSALTEEHKRRLLKRLEAMQRELHKITSDFTRFWGLFCEVGVSFGKFGTDVKPIVDRLNELAQIVISVIKATEGIAIGFSPVKLLETAMSKDSEKSKES